VKKKRIILMIRDTAANVSSQNYIAAPSNEA
jgi:hypothetical protein